MDEPYDEAQHRRHVDDFIREAQATVEITWEQREWIAWWFASTMLRVRAMPYAVRRSASRFPGSRRQPRSTLVQESTYVSCQPSFSPPVSSQRDALVPVQSRLKNCGTRYA